MGVYKSLHGRLFGVDSETGQLGRNGSFANGTPNGSTVTVKEYGSDVLHRTVLTCTATPVTITDDAGVAQYGGTAKLYDFPAGLDGSGQCIAIIELGGGYRSADLKAYFKSLGLATPSGAKRCSPCRTIAWRQSALSCTEAKGRTSRDRSL